MLRFPLPLICSSYSFNSIRYCGRIVWQNLGPRRWLQLVLHYLSAKPCDFLMCSTSHIICARYLRAFSVLWREILNWWKRCKTSGRCLAGEDARHLKREIHMNWQIRHEYMLYIKYLPKRTVSCRIRILRWTRRVRFWFHKSLSKWFKLECSRALTGSFRDETLHSFIHNFGECVPRNFHWFCGGFRCSLYYSVVCY